MNPSTQPVPTTASSNTAVEKKRAAAYKKIEQNEANLKRIIEANASAFREKFIGQSAMTTGPDCKPYAQVTADLQPYYKEGDYIKVDSDTSPNKNRARGFGFVMKATGVGSATIVEVKYDMAYDGGAMHKGVPFSATTVAIYGQNFETKTTRKRSAPWLYTETDEEPLPKKEKKQLPIEVLIEKLQHGARYSRKKGWHRDDLELMTLDDGQKKANGATKKHLNMDAKNVLLFEVTLLEQYLAATSGAKHAVRGKKSKKFEARSSKNDPLTLKYLVQVAWGCHNSYLCELRKKLAKQKRNNDEDHTATLLFRKPPDEDEGGQVPGSVIDSYTLAEKFYTAETLFCYNECKLQSAKDLSAVTRKLRSERMAKAKCDFAQLDSGKKAIWEARQRAHLLRQPAIRYQIIGSLRKNPNRSWVGVESDIDHWCSASAIYRWVTSRPGYRLYSERVVPLLNDAQRLKHLQFSKDFRNNHGLGPGKYLHIMYDEKWFWGMVMRRSAKSCEDLGLHPHTYKAYHKSHISKTMGVAFTAFAFEGCIENGGEAIKLGFFRAQSHKIAQREVRETVIQPDGSRKLNGPIKRRKGDKYLVDCCVTGSNPGTSADPKFTLLSVFEEYIFPMVLSMIGLGGTYEGYLPIFQGDNAGPHQEAAFMKFVTEYCARMKWHWKPQAPQMPHMNVLDLSVFPAMSKRHTSLARGRGGLSVLKEDDIWFAANEVWNELPSAKVASAYIQAYRIAQKVIAAGGDNDFLGTSGSIHVGVRKDFDETARGLKRKDGRVLPSTTR